MRHLTIADMESYLDRRLSSRSDFKQHVDNCNKCWKKWQNFRWDKAKSSEFYSELTDFLGDKFVEYFDSSWALAIEWNKYNRDTEEKAAAFYKEDGNYVYNLFIWAESGQRPKYVNIALPYLKKYNARNILDFGCGIGNDSLPLLERGFKVTSYDFNNKSMAFFRYRYKRRNFEGNTLVVGDSLSHLSFDVLWSMDVIEHLIDPCSHIKPFLMKAKVFIYDTECSKKSGGRQPFHFQHSTSHFHEFLMDLGYRKDKDSKDINVWFRAK